MRAVFPIVFFRVLSKKYNWFFEKNIVFFLRAWELTAVFYVVFFSFVKKTRFRELFHKLFAMCICDLGGVLHVLWDTLYRYKMALSGVNMFEHFINVLLCDFSVTMHLGLLFDYALTLL